jgi:hypothetical protein
MGAYVKRSSANLNVIRPRHIRTYVRMTSDGNPYARFRRALETGNETLVITAARELPQVRLDDALRICLVLRGGDPDRYERAAVRWLGRFALEAREVTINDLRLAANALDALPEHATEAMELLQRLCVARGVA